MPKYTFFLLLILYYDYKTVCGLYEDQIGKFDWKKEFLGSVKFSAFDTNSVHRDVVFVATEENVVASLSLKTGEIIWRKVLEKGNRGLINAFALINNVVLVVTGTDIVVVRGWHAKNGYLIHQWSPQFHPSEFTRRISWFTRSNRLFQLTFSVEEPLYFIEYRMFNGDKVRQKSLSRIIRPDSSCDISNALLVCSVNGRLLISNITSSEPVISDVPESSVTREWSSVQARSNNQEATFLLVSGEENFLFRPGRNSEIRKLENLLEKGDIYVQTNSQLSKSDVFSVLLIVNRLSPYTLKVEGSMSDENDVIFSRQITLKSPIGSPTISNADCNGSSGGTIKCSLLICTSDGSIIFIKSNGEVGWVREEALANIITAEMIELPMSDTDAEMQTEFDNEELVSDFMKQAADVLSMFSRRISSHVFQLQRLFLRLSGILEKSFSCETNQKSMLVRDYFNLHKIILVITKQMKIYAIDNISKELLWIYLLDEDEFEPFSAPSVESEVHIPLFIQRTYRHYPHPMLCTILLRNKMNKNGVVISFNPVTGEFESPVKLNYKMKQATLIPKQTAEDYLQGIVILSEDNSIHLYPEHIKPILKALAPNLFIHVANADLCQVDGFSFGSSIEKMSVIPAWSMKCTGKIIKIAGKNPVEKVHSQGRVLSDRSVLYKYINPNLIVIVSQSINPEDQKSMLTLYFVDSVTGVIVNGDVRHRASDPVHLVHSENWVVLMYFNDKARRTEVVTYELYEGKTQKNSTAFSSIQTKSLRPIIDSRAYILPTSYVEAAKETITEKGITSKYVLVALSTGNIIELPWILLDPRRPFTSTPEMKEEGILPYMPEIPVPSETMINYNQTLNRIRTIITSPSGLESTSLVFAYGLDMFYTRTAPSKTFDLLKEDFDYTLILIVLILLIVLTFVTKHLAYRRALRQAWR